MIQMIVKRVISEKGESLAEGLTALMIVTLAALSLATMILISEKSILLGEKRSGIYYEEEAQIEDYIKIGHLEADDSHLSEISGRLTLTGNNGSVSEMDINISKAQMSDIWAFVIAP